jgi:hypothetical protein
MEIEPFASGAFERAAQTLMVAKLQTGEERAAQMKGPALGGAWVPEFSGGA